MSQLRQTLCRLDREFNVLAWEVDELFGVTAEQAVGRSYWSIVSADAHRMRRLRELLEHGSWDGIAVVADKDNEHVVVRVTANGQHINGRVVSYDVTVREVFEPGYFPDC